MTHDPTSGHPSPPGEASPSSPPQHHDEPPRSLLALIWSTGQLLACVAATTAFLVWLMITPMGGHAGEEDGPKAPPEAVRPDGPSRVRIDTDSKLLDRLETTTVRSARVETPLLNATGIVVASMRPGTGIDPAYWQFNSPEVLTTYTDWQKAIADIAFLSTQLKRITELANSRVESQQKVVTQMRQLVKVGTETQKALAAEEATLRQYE